METSALWLQATGRKLDSFAAGGTKNLEVCSLHFTADQYDQKVLHKYRNSKVPPRVRVLLKGAVPRLNLTPQTADVVEAVMSRANRAVQRKKSEALKLDR